MDEPQLFQPGDNPRVRVLPQVAEERALMETLTLEDPAQHQIRVSRNKEGDILDAAIDTMYSTLVEQDVAEELVAQVDQNPALSQEDKLNILENGLERINRRASTKRDLAFMTYVLANRGSGNATNFQKIWGDSTFEQRNALINYQNEQHLVTLRENLSEAQENKDLNLKSWSGWFDIVGQALQQDVLPFMGEWSRSKMIDVIEEVSGLEAEGLLPGTERQSLREQLARMPLEKKAALVPKLSEALRALDDDSAWGFFIAEYGINEQFDGVFSEGVITGESNEDEVDRLLGNGFFLLEAAVTGIGVAKLGKVTAKSALKGTNVGNSRIFRRAKVNKPLYQELTEIFRTQGLPINVDRETVAIAQLPKPAAFVDDVTEVPSAVRDTLREVNEHSDAILESAEQVGRNLLTTPQKADTIGRELAALTGNTSTLRPELSTVALLDNQAGFKVEAVVGRSSTEGFATLDEAVQYAKELDPDLKEMSIFKINERGIRGDVISNVDEQLAEVARRTENVPDTQLELNLGGDFYLKIDHERFWQPSDKIMFGDNVVLKNGRLSRWLVSPNGRYGDEIFKSFEANYRTDQNIFGRFDTLFKPYYNLGLEDKRFISSVFDWSEDFGKTNGRAPTLTETMDRYGQITEQQMKGLVALRGGFDTMYELVNERLYRNWQANGFQTASNADVDIPAYHGKILDDTEASRDRTASRTYFDPITEESVSFTRQDLDDLYQGGGRIMKLDLEVDGPSGSHTRIIIDPEDGYSIYELTTTPLKYTPGYSIRFYDDPWFVVRKDVNRRVDGDVVSTKFRDTPGKTVFTAPTQSAGLFRVDKLNADAPAGVRYELVPAKSLNVTDSAASVKQLIHREGRLFYDNRNPEPLKNIYGSNAKLEDPVSSIQHATALLSRQIGTEDLLSAVKNAFKNDYQDLIPSGKLDTLDVDKVGKELRIQFLNSTGDKKTRAKDALAIWDYIQLVEGVDSPAIGYLRKAGLDLALWASQYGKSQKLEKWLMSFDPTRTARSATFNLFMVLRPIKQLFLQGSQIMFLSPLDPNHVFGGQVFKDAFALRRGFSKLRSTNFEDGIKNKVYSDMMGLTNAEYNIVARRFEQSGLIDEVDVTAFAGGTRKFKKLGIPETRFGTFGYRARQAVEAIRGPMQKFGFDLGEGNNKVFTYSMALRQFQKRNPKLKIADYTDDQWDQINISTSNMALGMSRPNNLPYQQGMLGVTTQFLSFGHKSALALMGQNPAIKGSDAIKIVLGTYVLYGADMYGARDWVEDRARNAGLTNPLLIDILAGGMVDTVFNRVWGSVIDDWKDLDISGTFAPGINLSLINSNIIETMAEQPPYSWAFGPTGSIAGDTLKAIDFGLKLNVGNPDLSPRTKFTQFTTELLTTTVPMFGDMRFAAVQLDKWYREAGEPEDMRHTLNTILARGLLGVRSREEIARWSVSDKSYEQSTWQRERASDIEKFLEKYVKDFGDGLTDYEGLQLRTGMALNLLEGIPEPHRTTIQRMVINPGEGKKSIQEQMGEILSNRYVDGPSHFDRELSAIEFKDDAERDIFQSLIKQLYENNVEMDRYISEQNEEFLETNPPEELIN